MSTQRSINHRPKFLIVGAMKAGTTSLAQLLNAVPGIYIPDEELHFFNNNKHFGRGQPYYSSLFSQAQNGDLLGEKTPSYSYQPNVAQRIFEYDPEMKLIWVLREPVSRAYSNYWHAVRAGKERLNFSQAVEAEPERLKKNIFQGYLERSRYAKQIEHYSQYFPMDRMCFVIYEHLLADVKNETMKVLEYLDVRFEGSEFPKLPWRNATAAKPVKVPKVPWLNLIVKKNFSSKSKAAYWNRKYNKRKVIPEPLDPEYKKSLKKQFLNDNERLAELLGRDLSVWN